MRSGSEVGACLWAGASACVPASVDVPLCVRARVCVGAPVAVSLRPRACACVRVRLRAADMFHRHAQLAGGARPDAESEAAGAFTAGLARRLSSRLFFVAARAVRLPPAGYAAGLQLLTATLLYLLGEGTGTRGAAPLTRHTPVLAHKSTTRTHVHTLTYTHAHAHAHAHTHEHARTYTRTRSATHARTNTRTRSATHLLTHLHTRTLYLTCFLELLAHATQNESRFVFPLYPPFRLFSRTHRAHPGGALPVLPPHPRRARVRVCCACPCAHVQLLRACVPCVRALVRVYARRLR
jgi:hypothetical protein